MEQPLPHPGGFIQCQPADETLQTVKTHEAPADVICYAQMPAGLEIDVTIHSDLRSLITAQAFVCASHLQV